MCERKSYDLILLLPIWKFCLIESQKVYSIDFLVREAFYKNREIKNDTHAQYVLSYWNGRMFTRKCASKVDADEKNMFTN